MRNVRPPTSSMMMETTVANFGPALRPPDYGDKPLPAVSSGRT